MSSLNLNNLSIQELKKLVKDKNEEVKRLDQETEKEKLIIAYKKLQNKEEKLILTFLRLRLYCVAVSQRSNAARVRNIARFVTAKIVGNSKNCFKMSKDKTVTEKGSNKH